MSAATSYLSAPLELTTIVEERSQKGENNSFNISINNSRKRPPVSKVKILNQKSI